MFRLDIIFVSVIDGTFCCPNFWDVDAPWDLEIWIGIIVVPDLGMYVLHVIWSFYHIMGCMDAGIASWDYVIVTREII
jgi:hypothetical protein